MIQCYDKIIYKRIDEIIPYENNARVNDRAIEALVEDIPVVGFNVPIVIDKGNVIVKGHSRYEALKRLGVELVPCIVIDGDPDDIAEERLLDNKLSELATWDEEKYKHEVRELKLDLRKFHIEIPKVGGEAVQIGQQVTPEQVARAAHDLTGDGRQVSSEKKSLVEIHCPNCGEDFFADMNEVMKYAN